MVRATGPTCHGLLEEGYDTKGYRIHGKSCDWGPMAGFVMRDPRLNKYGKGKAKFNKEKHQEALIHDHENQGWKASTTPLKISIKRLEWLIHKGEVRIDRVALGGRLDGTAFHPSGVHFHYSMFPEKGKLYGLYFDWTRPGCNVFQMEGLAKWAVSSADVVRPRTTGYQPMLAMTNPPTHRKFRQKHHLNAITGDYDLFAIWPKKTDYNPNARGLDYRPLGTVRGATKDESKNIERLEEHFTELGNGTAREVPSAHSAPGNWQGTKLGNITERIYLVCQLVNSIVGSQVLWHSDEAARPFLDDVDLPIVAITPKHFYAIREIDDFKIWIKQCDEKWGLQVTLSNAWTLNPEGKKTNRLGSSYERFVPADNVRTLAPDWYNM